MARTYLLSPCPNFPPSPDPQEYTSPSRLRAMKCLHSGLVVILMISHFVANDSMSTGPCSKFEYIINKQYLTWIILNEEWMILTLVFAIYINSGIQDFVFRLPQAILHKMSSQQRTGIIHSPFHFIFLQFIHLHMIYSIYITLV